MTARKARNKPTKTDLAVVILSPIIATIITVLLNTNLLISVTLFFGLPALYLSLRKPWIVKKSLAFTFILSIPPAIFLDYPSHINRSWFVPTSFDFRIFGVIPLEDVIFAFLWIYYAVVFYEYFIDLGKKSDGISLNIKYLGTLTISVLVLFLFILVINSDLLYIRHFYLKAGVILLLIPLITYLAFFPRFIAKYIRIAVYFFGLSLLFELTALHTNQWTFYENNVIGTIKLLGQSFPYEEFFFWFVIGVPAVLVYYEFFADDRK